MFLLHQRFLFICVFRLKRDSSLYHRYRENRGVYLYDLDLNTEGLSARALWWQESVDVISILVQHNYSLNDY